MVTCISNMAVELGAATAGAEKVKGPELRTAADTLTESMQALIPGFKTRLSAGKIFKLYSSSDTKYREITDKYVVGDTTYNIWAIGEIHGNETVLYRIGINKSNPRREELGFVMPDAPVVTYFGYNRTRKKTSEFGVNKRDSIDSVSRLVAKATVVKNYLTYSKK